MENVEINIPKPGWSNSLSYGWATMKWAFLPLFLVVIVLAVVDMPMEFFRDKYSGDADEWKELLENRHFYWSFIVELFGLAYWLLFVPVIDYSANLLFIHAVRRERPDVKEIIAGFNNYITVILANLLTIALIGISLIAFIIPGIFVACRLAFVSYLVMDKDLDPVAAVETSWKMTRGHGWKIFALGFTSIFIFIGGFLLFFVGIIPAIIWIKASFASLYQSVLEQPGSTEPAVSPA